MSWFAHLVARGMACVVRLLLSLRYKVKVKGLDQIPRDGGVIFFSNHPALIDPIITMLHVGIRHRVRPLALEHFFFMPGLKLFMNLVGAFAVPDLSLGSNSYKRYRHKEAAQQIEQGLKEGQRFLVYPAGSLKRSANEVIGGASMAHQVVRDAPEVPVVLIRIEGLWGSRFSTALTGKRPDLMAECKRGLVTTLKNLIFFSPRRRITITVERAAPEILEQTNRLDFNRKLEQWFNRYQPDGREEEPLSLVRESFWSRASLPAMAIGQAKEVIDTSDLPEDVKRGVLEEIAALVRCDVTQIQDSDELGSKLGMDSLDIAQLMSYLEKQFDVTVTTPAHITTVSHVMAAASGIQFGEEEELSPVTWHQDVDERRPKAFLPEGATLPEVWLHTCKRMAAWEAAGDDRAGPKSYDQLNLGIVLMARKIAQLPGKNIGIMLPAATAAPVIVLATLLAGKTPVMLNWTMGPGPLKHAVKLSGLETVLTALSFIDRLEGADLSPIHEKIVVLEAIKQDIGLIDLLKAKLILKKSPKAILKSLGRHEDKATDTAVILFTSGTESVPKGVPLTHQNILANHRAVLSCIELNHHDVMLSCIPPFHSFGLSVTSLLPMLAGVRTAFYPDPTNGRGMARACSNWHCSVVCAPPTFLRNLFRADGGGGALASLRYVVSGAERAPEELVNSIAKLLPQAQFIEGYGITECSPVLTLTPPGMPRIGVGLPLPNVRLMIVHPETFEPLPFGERGLIVASGANIFPGYLGDTASPFWDFEGSRWYITGDLGFIDAAGFLTISGRLKRFVKIGGEMVSLAAVEQVLAKAAPAEAAEAPALAVVAKENAGSKTTLHAFTTFELGVERANQLLRQEGFSNLIKVAGVNKIAALPLLGSGKINYRGLPEV